MKRLIEQTACDHGKFVEHECAHGSGLAVLICPGGSSREVTVDVESLVSWMQNASSALDAATTIGMRSCRPGDGLHYANHDRLVAEAARHVSALGGGL